MMQSQIPEALNERVKAVEVLLQMNHYDYTFEWVLDESEGLTETLYCYSGVFSILHEDKDIFTTIAIEDGEYGGILFHVDGKVHGWKITPDDYEVFEYLGWQLNNCYSASFSVEQDYEEEGTVYYLNANYGMPQMDSSVIDPSVYAYLILLAYKNFLLDVEIFHLEFPQTIQ